MLERMHWYAVFLAFVRLLRTQTFTNRDRLDVKAGDSDYCWDSARCPVCGIQN